MAQITPNYAADIYGVALASCEPTGSEIISRQSSGPKLVQAATRLQESARQAHDARDVLLLRREPPFAESTYTVRDLEAHTEALQQPLMPSRHARC